MKAAVRPLRSHEGGGSPQLYHRDCSGTASQVTRQGRHRQASNWRPTVSGSMSLPTWTRHPSIHLSSFLPPSFSPLLSRSCSVSPSLPPPLPSTSLPPSLSCPLALSLSLSLSPLPSPSLPPSLPLRAHVCAYACACVRSCGCPGPVLDPPLTHTPPHAAALGPAQRRRRPGGGNELSPARPNQTHRSDPI